MTIKDALRSRTSARPLAHASGRVAWTRRIFVTLLTAVVAGTALGACAGEPTGLGDPPPSNGGGGGIGGGGGGTGGGGTGGVPVPSFTTLTAGDLHTCALSETGVAWCWGSNADGQLGRGTTSTTARPNVVSSGSTAFSAISAGASHTCAIDSNGVGYCWGSNVNGQLGIGTTTARSSTPVRVAGSRGWRAISAGRTHTCAIAENGTPFCWGSNSNGELGTGSSGDVERSPVQVAGLSEVLAIAAGDGYTCALRSTSAAVCWGREDRLGTDGASDVPVAVDGSATYAGIEAGGRVTCAIEPNVQRAACWGDPEGVGNASASGNAPTRVTLDADIALVSSGQSSACALQLNGLARCWGSNAFGQLGLGAAGDTASVTPAPVSGDLVFRTISVGAFHACGITERLETFCWGRNTAGQLGTAASATLVRTPTRVP